MSSYCPQWEDCNPSSLLPGRSQDNPWPEWPKVCKTDYGQQEAIALYGHDPRIYESTVKEFVKDKEGKLTAVKIDRKSVV